jgi:hypothetical protein
MAKYEPIITSTRDGRSRYRKIELPQKIMAMTRDVNAPITPKIVAISTKILLINSINDIG